MERQRKASHPGHRGGFMRLGQPKTENYFWVIDYRIFDPETDGLSKLDHVEEMLRSAEHRRMPLRTVLMDSWYATKDLMVLMIDGMGE
jgi:hypothetical protein